MSNLNNVFLYDGPVYIFITYRHLSSDKNKEFRMERYLELLDDVLVITYGAYSDVAGLLPLSAGAANYGNLSKGLLPLSAGAANYGNLSKGLLPLSAGAANYGNRLGLPSSASLSLSTKKYKSPIKVIHSGEVPLRRHFVPHPRVFSFTHRTRWVHFPPHGISGYLPTQTEPRAVHLPCRPAEASTRHDIPTIAA